MNALRTANLGLRICAAVLLFSALASAQEPEKKFRLDALDKAWIGAVLGDRISTEIAAHRCATCREVGPIKSPWAVAGIQAGAFAAVKWIEYRYPDQRRAAKWFKRIAVGVGTAVIIHNLTRSERSKI